MRKALIALVALVALATAGTTVAAAPKDGCGGTCPDCTERPAGGEETGLTLWEMGP